MKLSAEDGMQEMRQGVVELSDGRSVGYADWGEPDAPNRIVYCHGTPGCRLEITAPLHLLAAAEANVRLTAFDRPGYGRSAFRPYRSFMQWLPDLEEAVDELGIGTFALLGGSGGSPYAVAAAIALCDRVTRLDIVVGTGPPRATGMDQSALARLVSRNWLRRRIEFGLVGKGLRAGQADKVLDRSIATLGAADQEAMARPEVREWFAAEFAEATRQGGRAAAAEVPLYWKDWEFGPEEVRVATRLWYGKLDTNVPATVGEWLADRIDGSRLTVWPDQGHFTWTFDANCIAAITAPATLPV